MKDLILIGDYSNTPEKKDLLFELVTFFKKKNKEVMISSHVVPDEIVMRKCDYFIYDKENKLLTDKNYIGYSTFWSDHLGIYTKLPARQNTFLAVMRILLNGLSMAKNLKYDVVHYVEYDSKINNITEFEQNFLTLSNSQKKGIGYFVEDWMSGNYICFNMNKIESSELIYDENKLLQNIDILCETFLYSRFLQDDVIRKEFDLINNDNFTTGLCSGDFLYWGIVFFHNDDYYVLCYNHEKKNNIIFNVISDGVANNLWLAPKNFSMFKLQKNTQYVKIFGNDKLYLDLDLNNSNVVNFIKTNTTVTRFE